MSIPALPATPARNAQLSSANSEFCERAENIFSLAGLSLSLSFFFAARMRNDPLISAAAELDWYYQKAIYTTPTRRVIPQEAWQTDRRFCCFLMFSTPLLSPDGPSYFFPKLNVDAYFRFLSIYRTAVQCSNHIAKPLQRNGGSKRKSFANTVEDMCHL